MLDDRCPVPNCGRPVRYRQLCGAHLARFYRHGDVRAHIPLKGTDTDPNAFWCSKCHTHKPKSCFYSEPRARRGISGVCIECAKKVKETRRDAIRERDRLRFANSEARRASKREAVRREDPAARNARQQAWRHANKERTRRQIAAQNAARRALTLNAAGRVTQSQIKARWDYYGNKCWMCGAPATDTDHVKPLARGGCNWPANLRPACRRCNRSKSATWPYNTEGNTWQSTPSPGSPA